MTFAIAFVAACPDCGGDAHWHSKASADATITYEIRCPLLDADGILA